MSRGLQRVVDNFVKGLQIGWTHRDRQDDRQAKIDAAKAQAAKWAQQADLKRQELGISSRKADAYVGLSGAQADYYRRKGAGGAATKSTDINPSTAAWLNQSGGETLSTTQPAPPTLVTQESMPAGPAPPPGGEGGGISLDDAQGGKIPKLARGGMAARTAQAFSGGLQNSWRMANQRAQQARTPPINPNATWNPGPGGGASAPVLNPSQPITRTSSTPMAVSPQPDGSTGPGSGFGIMAAPPVSGMGYQRGGRVQRFADGGTPDPGKPSILSVMADAFGHRLGVQNLGDRFRDRRAPPQNPPPTSSTPGPGQPLPPRFTNDDRAASTAWAENQGGPPQIKRTDRNQVPIPQPGTYDDQDYRAHPSGQPQAQPTGPLPAYDNVYPKFDIDPSKIVQPTAAPARTGGGGGGGGGYQARGGGLGDQRRTAAYDPVADRMDPRNTGIVYAPGETPAGREGNVNQQVYAAAQHGGIELNQPGQQIYRRGGPVRRFETGGKARFAKDEPRLINPRVTPGMADIPVGRGRASLGLNYDPSSKYGSVEGGYEHPVGRDTTLGVYGNIGKDLGPEGASAKPEWGVGVRGRVKFADGGEVPGMALPPPPNQLPGGGDDTGMTGVRKREESSGGRGGGGGGGGGGGFDFGGGGGDGSAGTGGVGGSADDGSGGSAAAGVGGDDGGTYRRGGRVQRFAGGGAPVVQGDRLPVPESGREYRTPPQGGGEATSEGQAEADMLTQQWREEAMAAAQHNQRVAEQSPLAGAAAGPGVGNVGGGGPQVHGSTFPGPSPNLTGPSQDSPPGPSRPIHGATFPGPSPNLTGPSRDTPRPPPAFAGEEARADERPRPRAPQPGNMDLPLPPDPDLPNFATTYEPGDTGVLPQPSVGNNAGTERSTDQDIHPANRPGPGGRPVATGQPQATGRTQAGAGPKTRKPLRDQTREEAYDPVADRADPDNVNMVDDTGKVNPPQGPPAPGGKGAVDTKAPMAQGVGEPMGGQGLQGPGKNVSTNNAARDYLGAATTFADWALKDAGPQKKEEAQHALFTGKGAATPHEVGALMMAVDPENKMPLDKRFDAAAKLAHDYHIGEGDVKMASESAFNVIQFGVTKAREHGAEAMKLAQAGNEQGALKEIMAGYTWLADKATAAVKDGSIVVTGDDGKVRAQIPLQPGTVQNLAAGMMTGQLPWDAIRKGAAAGGDVQPQQAKQAVDTNYPATGNAPPPTTSGSAAQSQAAPAAPAPAPAAPAPARATASAPAPALDTTPPVAQPKSPTPAPAPPSAASGASRPSAPTSSQTPPAGGTQPGKPDSVVRLKPKAPTDLMVPAASASSSTSQVKPAQTDKAAESKTTEKTDTTSGKDDEKTLKEWHAKNPYEPPPDAPIDRKASPATPELHGINKALEDNRKAYEAGIAQIDKNAVDGKVPKADFAKYRPQLIAKLKEKHDHVQSQIEKQRDRVLDRSMAAEEREREAKTRKITQEEEAKFQDTFKTRAEEIMKAEGRTPSQKAAAQAALERSVLRYQISPAERRETERLAREVWKTNEQMDTKDAFDTIIGMTEIHAKDTGKTMNYQKGENATSFRPVTRNVKGDYVVMLPGQENVTISPNVYQRIINLHRQNWAQQGDTTKQKEESDYKQSQARKNLGARTLEALSYTNPFTLGPRIGLDISKGAEKK